MLILVDLQELEEENSQDLHRSPAKETCFILLRPEHLIDHECIDIAPGVGKQPKSILNDKFCEELNFPHLFPTGKYGYQVQRDINLIYLNQRLLHYRQTFASDTDYVFFTRNVLQDKHFQEQINIVMRKVSARNVRAGLLNNANFHETLRQYLQNDQTFVFMNSVKGSPAYWEKSEVLTMVKKLGVPAIFVTFSSADFSWNEMVEIIQKLKQIVIYQT